MSEANKLYENAVTTDRSAEFLARKHGFKDLSHLAANLPKCAKIIDVGAGVSPFGKELAKLRADIEVVCFDFSYSNPEILGEIQKESPDNLRFVAGDATKLSEYFKPEEFDAVFSYWLLPHLSLDNPEPAKLVASELFDITKSGGWMSVGPKTTNRRYLPLGSGPAIKIIKTRHRDDAERAIFIDRITTETSLAGISLKIQRLANEIATPYFGTTLYSRREGRIPHIYDKKSGEYVNPFKPRVLAIITGIAYAALKHTLKTSR